jgi:hypothetical protein
MVMHLSQFKENDIGKNTPTTSHTFTADDFFVEFSDSLSICDNFTSNFQEPSTLCFSINSIMVEVDSSDKDIIVHD